MPALNFLQQGQGPLVVLSHALGCDLTMWDGVTAALQDRYTVLRYDHRGHGRSPASAGAYTADDLSDDAAGLIRAHAAGGPVHFVGLSMGGMTAQALGAREPQLVRSLAIANSASHYDDAARAMWQARIDTVLAQGVPPIADGALQRWFTPEFRADQAHGGAARVAALRAVLEATAAAPYAAACDAVARIDLDAGNARIACPTLVIAGSRDEATPPAMSERIAHSIPGAQLRSLDAAHLSAVEQPQAFAALLVGFWSSLPA
ncbi:MAG TPA: alpha/beta fold hydrolase [Ramlibacter sp.]|nr:alpha/beta fold hydrolase [Ramlibacter sp.]